MDEPLELTILLPAWNEGGHLAQVLGAARAAAAELTDSFEILVVDGGSQDETVAAAESAGARVARQRGRGYGAAIREGLALARGRWVLAMDADGSHPARYFPQLWSRRERSDLVIASRFVPGGEAHMPWWRYALSWLLNTATRAVLDLPIRDSSSGLRLYRREAAAGLPLSAEDFSIQQELLVNILARGGRVEEIPFSYEPRLGGKSKADVGLLARRYLRMLWTLKALRGGRKSWLALGAVLALGTATGLWGIGWGLPGAARLRVLPGGQRLTPQAAQELAAGWARLYAGIEKAHENMAEEPANLFPGFGEFPPGWYSPPEKLSNSIRSMLLQTENPDEKKPFTNLSRMRPWKLEFKPLYVHYGGAFLYPFGAFVAAGALGGAIHAVPGIAHYLQQPEDMGRLFLWGRLFILIFHLGALVLLFALGCRLEGWRAGLLAAVLFAICPVAVDNGHILKPYPYATFWSLAACWMAVSAHRRGERAAYLLGGLCAGLAFGANLSLPIFTLLPLLIWGLRRRRGEAQRREWLWAAGAVALSAAVFALCNPYLFLSYKDYAWELEVHSPQRLRLNPWTFLTLMPDSAAHGMGAALAAAGAAGLALALFRRDSGKALAAIALACFAMISLRFPLVLSAGGFRLLHTVAALACLMAAAWLCRLPRYLRALCIMAVLADSGLRSFVLLENMRLDATAAATRAQAAAWLEKNVPPGGSIGLLRYPEPSHTPAFAYNRYHLVVFDQPQALAGRPWPDYLMADPQAAEAVESWNNGIYEVAARFASYRKWWAPPADDVTSANATFCVYRRKG